jgi:single-strand DNA-binding protein
MNLVIMKGRMTSDATIRTANSGTTVASFSLAIDRRFKDKVTGDKITDFIRMTAFGKTAEFIQKYTGRGKEILIVGEMQQDDFTDKNGAEQHTYQVVVSQVHLCGSNNDSAQYSTA